MQYGSQWDANCENENGKMVIYLVLPIHGLSQVPTCQLIAMVRVTPPLAFHSYKSPGFL